MNLPSLPDQAPSGPPLFEVARKLRGKAAYEPRHCQLVVDLMSVGASKTEVAAEIGISRRTLGRWEKDIPEMSEALEIGLTLAEAWWEQKGRKSLDNKIFKEALFFMHMRNRFGWTNSDDAAKKGALPLLIVATNLSIKPGAQEGEAYTIEVVGERVDAPVGELTDESGSQTR